ncbi:MAG: aspartate carbamoyltransferase [Gammaproteobacteria bacterium]|nr:aspartate carbamoyltransferase [Gammaproteobacteria bacterium]
MFHVIDTRQFDRPMLDHLCRLATHVRTLAKSKAGAQSLQALAPDRRAMLYFTQPSTRTFLSFNSACHILGMRTSEIRNPSISSEVKGETFEDSIRTFSSYADVIIMRTPEGGKAARAAEIMNAIPRPVPVINAGSGPDQHPTQALLDIYTLERSFEQRGGIDGRTIAMMGDLRRGRTVRSLSYLMKNYKDVRLRFVAPPGFEIKRDILDHLDAHGIEHQSASRLDDILDGLDALYVTRLQKEYDERNESESADYAPYSIGPEQLRRFPSDAIIMHPLPRGPELAPGIDNDPRVMYWRQERNGMWMRAALLAAIFDLDSGLDME